MLVTTKIKHPIPEEVLQVAKTLENKGFSAFLVGGCVRDLILNIKPKDWDITTDANPEEIINLFSDTFYENEYGTVGVVFEKTKDPTVKVIEVTPFRKEGSYSDKRRPDHVTFGTSLEEDLKRRDFTINAFAYSCSQNKFIDLYNGEKDLKDKIIRTVGLPDERFNEDALRILRAIRLYAELGFEIESETQKSIKKNGKNLEKIARERIRDEFIRIIESPNPLKGLEMCRKLGILNHISPELKEGIGIKQNKAHIYDVWEHQIRSLQAAADKNWPLEVRLAALFHDIGKPKTRRKSEETGDWTFYGHEVVGAKMTRKIMGNLKFPKEITENVVILVRWHMFFSDTETITNSAVRRMLSRVGKENIWSLMNLRICDRVGMGRPKENPYRLRKYKSLIEEVLRDPVSVGMLKINGQEIMQITKLSPGPKIGHILHALLEEVLEDPLKNTKKYLENKAKDLAVLNEKQLSELGYKGKNKKEKEEEIHLRKIRDKYWVK